MYPIVKPLCAFCFLCPLTSSLSSLKRYRSPSFKKWFSLSWKCAFSFCKCSLWFHACEFFYFSQNVLTFLFSLFMQNECPFFMKYLYLAFSSMCCLFLPRLDLSFHVSFSTFSWTILLSHLGWPIGYLDTALGSPLILGCLRPKWSVIAPFANLFQSFLSFSYLYFA